MHATILLIAAVILLVMLLLVAMLFDATIWAGRCKDEDERD